MKNVFKFVTIVLISLMSYSCMTQKQWARRFPPSIDTVRITTSRDSIVIKDSLISFFIEGETKIDSIIIPCPPPPVTYKADTAKVETKLANAKAWLNKSGKIEIILKQKDTALLLKIAIKEAYYWQSEYMKITKVPEPVKYIPKAYTRLFWFTIGIFVIILGFIGFKIYKKISQ